MNQGNVAFRQFPGVFACRRTALKRSRITEDVIQTAWDGMFETAKHKRALEGGIRGLIPKIMEFTGIVLKIAAFADIMMNDALTASGRIHRCAGRDQSAR